MATHFRQIFPRPNWLKDQMNGPTELLANWLLRAWNTIGQVQEWIEIGESNAPAFENSWANVGGSYETAAFYRDPFGRVHIKGAVDTGTSGTTAFTLPEGYRPAATLRLACYSTGNAYVEITSAGLVQPQRSGSAANYLGISFRAEQ